MLLVFYPADHSPVCTQQLRSYSEDLNEFDRFGATVLCLSPQDVASHEEFAAAQSLRLPLLSDLDKAVGEAYGILGPLGFYRRSIFVVDREGVIRYARRSLSNLTYVSTADLVEALGARSRLVIHQLARPAASFERVFALGIDPGLSRCGYGAVDGAGGRFRWWRTAI